MKTHKLKIQDHFYKAIEKGYKTFEVRKDDRDFQTGDFIDFTTIDGETREGQWKITYKLTHEDFPEGIPEGYCVLGIYPINRVSDRRLFEIINGSGFTDAEMAKIARSAVGHCKKRESIGELTIYKASQGGTWWDAFLALFRYMEERQ